MNSKKPLVVKFKDVDRDDTPFVGGKGANLGEMVKAGFPVPDGFIVTAPAYFYLVKHNHLENKIRHQLENVDVNDPHALKLASNRVKRLIYHAEVPKDLANEILEAYDKLGKDPLVAIRSSATAEDLPEASFAGQQETFLNVKGDANVVDAIRKAWASLFEPRAIFYREQKGFDHFKVGLAAPVQLMIQSDVSGVMFTINPVTNDKEFIIIEAIWGLGEKIVQGEITPDHYQVKKRDWTIYHKEIVEQHEQLIKRGNKNIETKVPKKLRRQQKISDKLIIELAKIGHKLHQHYFFPQDIEWAFTDKLYILQTRPITTIKEVGLNKASVNVGRNATKNLKKIISGDSASPGLVSGVVRIIKSTKHIGKLKAGEILVADMTTPSFVPIMKKAAALITNKGGQTSHAAIVSRELGLPCIVGTVDGTRKLKDGQVITVDAQMGDVFSGALPAKKSSSVRIVASKRNTLKEKLKTATKAYVNLSQPDLAAEISKRNVDGVGLLRAEFMIAAMGSHPKKIIEDGKQSFFVNELASGLEKFCLSFGNRPVIYRTNDFKTNEYRSLTGGIKYEPQEENPLMGFRGACRYLADSRVFELELKAIKKVRNKMGLKNLWIMFPFVRTVDELVKVKRLVASHGLVRSSTLKMFLMVEIPSNVILLEEFYKVGIDGISIGSNDLTMLVLGADRDNEELTKKYDVRDPAVLNFLELAIKKANKLGITSSICGQAPSQFPDLTQKLVDWGISSISVSPDMIEQTRQIIYDAENRKVRK